MNFSELQAQGFIRVPEILDSGLLDEFEAVVSALGTALLARKRVEPRSADTLADALRTGGDYRVRLFNNLKNLYVVNKMSQRVAQRLEDAGFFAWSELTAPLLYPSLRADVPGEQTYLLPMHQDYATQCRRAWRLWIPLRDANAQAGTMCLVPGSHARGVLTHDTTDPATPYVPPSEYGGTTPQTLDMTAGDGVLFDPLLVHASVPSTIDRMKYVLLIQVQDLATIADPDDPDDPLPARLALAAQRDRLRAAPIAAGKAR